VYRTFKGWKEDISKVKTFDKLPKNAQIYINYLTETLNVPITYISVGNDRMSTIRK
jgi:adenylosuccinate synthase